MNGSIVDSLLGLVVIRISITLNERVEVHFLALLVAPNIFCQIRVVDKRITVALDLVDFNCSVQFFLTYRVETMPFEQQVA